jgi:hypothetical protein
MDLWSNVIVSLLALWVLGISFASSVGGLIHLLLAMAFILIMVRLSSGATIVSNFNREVI